MNLAFRFALLGACILAGNLAWSDPDPAVTTTAKRPLSPDEVRSQVNALDAPNGTSAATTYQSKFSAETSTDKSTASLDVAYSGNLSGNYFFNVAFSAKAPFDSSKSDSTDLGSLSGLTAGTQAHLALSISRWPEMTVSGTQDIEGFRNSKYFSQLYGGYPWLPPLTDLAYPSMRQALKDAKQDPSPEVLIVANGETYLQIIGALNKQIDAYNAKNQNVHGFTKLPRVIPTTDYHEVVTAAKNAYYTLVETKLSPWSESLSLTLDGNQQNFSFATSQTPTKVTKESKNGAGASLVASVLHENWLASLSFGYTRSYMAQPQGQICTPIAGTTSSECVNGSIGAPKKTTGRLITAEFRQRFGAAFAVSPQVQYSEVDSKWGVRVPIYLVADKTKALNGGVTLGWTTKDHFGAAVFVGKAFSF